MIFVTVGSFEFDELARKMDELALKTTEEIIIQIANGSYVPINCKYFKTTNTIKDYYEKADLIISHGGTGTVLEVLELGTPLISLANPSLKDNHQHEFLELMESRNFLIYCRNLDDLGNLILEKRSFKTRTNKIDFYAKIVHDIESFKISQSTKKAPFHAKILSRVPAKLKKIQI
jgi:beta-1,4-N-acetylglucosaminyltransferase